ncbi:MAG: DUF4296 domain-containing protein [Prevotella sp.]|nr:DUF4296 domain-containing protein [Prevotella sp.]
MQGKIIHYIYIGIVLILLSACKPGVPGKYIQPGDMEDILYDYYISQGMASVPGPNMDNEDYKRDLYFNAVLKKHRVTRAEFDSSLVYYYTRADYFVDICHKVQDRLSQDALDLGASEGEVERFTAYSITGDTADVWEGNRSLMLIPYAPYHRHQFVQKADTSYHQGDRFMLAFKTLFLYQGGSKDALVYLALKYENDSIVSKVTRFSVTGDTQLRIDACDQKVKEVMGYFYLGDGYEKNTDLKLLFLTDIHLIRFHKQKNDQPTKPATETLKADSVKISPDSVRKLQRHQFGIKPISRNE